MTGSKNKRFYFIALGVLIVLSAYPLWGGAKMVYLSITQGAISPEQYVKYVIPYAAICVSLIWFTALHPLFFKLRRFAFPVGLATAFCVFFAVEVYLETLPMLVAGMTPIDPATLTPGVGEPGSTVEAWQAYLCVVSPNLVEQSTAYTTQDSLYYVIGGSYFKVHFYLISLLMITMMSGLVYSLAKRLRFSEQSTIKPIVMRGSSTAVFIALCLFANATAFFRQADPIQTPLASVLTCTFFVLLGVTVGVNVGSFLTSRQRSLRVSLPVFLSALTVVLMYLGEALMMQGNLYRFGTGWFFDGLPYIVLAPVDILIILLAAFFTSLILGSLTRTARKKKQSAL
ncbi:MAG: hypothetical protein FWE41_02500 [Coriobacteriia bacterium]|nr:hypothetical protein [Coriobacteriia bacterium]MCL2750762.1 hypothetical protein [Coriobacteriia bacterium]